MSYLRTWKYGNKAVTNTTIDLVLVLALARCCAGSPEAIAQHSADSGSGVQPAALLHFAPVAPTGKSQPVYIFDALGGCGSLEAGDEIAVFDGGLCVGAETITVLPAVNPITCWLEFSAPGGAVLPGAQAGNEMSFVGWDASADVEIPLAVSEVISGPTPPVFQEAAIVAVSLDGDDLIPPEAVCQDLAIQVEAGLEVIITPQEVDAGSTDNCGIATMAVSPDTFTCADVGENTVTLTVTDTSGNPGTCEATVTVGEDIAPLAVCQDITVSLDAAGNASISGEDVDAGSTDNCGIASLVVSPDAFTCADIGENTVTLTVSDYADNTDSCTATVTVTDTQNPVITACPADVTVDGDANCTGVAPDLAALASVDDNCAATLTQDPAAGSMLFLGDTVVTITATDLGGNTDTCTVLVTVADTFGLCDLEGHLAELAALLLQDFASHDTNQDGRLSFSEAQAAIPGLLIGEHESLDSNGQGNLRVSELIQVAGPDYVHNADQNGDKVVDLPELLRLIQLFNLGAYHCAENAGATEDGYLPGEDMGQTDCLPHASDYSVQDWSIDLFELLRIIQLFNAWNYHPCPGGEDGFCPGAE